MCHGWARNSATLYAVLTTVRSVLKCGSILFHKAGQCVAHTACRRRCSSDWEEVSAANRATPVDSRSMSNTHPRSSEARCSKGSRPKAQDRRSNNCPVHHAERDGSFGCDSN